MGSAELLSFFSLPFPLGGGRGVDIHTSCGRSKVCTLFFRYRPFHSAPNTRPLVLSFRRILTGSPPCTCTRTHDQLHPFSLFLSLSSIRTHALSIILSRSLLLVSLLCFTLPIFFLSLFFSPLLIIYTHARSCLSFSYSATFKYRIFRNN